MKQRVILFDFDGVIADSFDVFYQALVRTLREFGYSCVRNPSDFRALFDRNLFQSLTTLQVQVADQLEVLAEVGRKVQGRVDDLQAFPGVTEAIRDLCQDCPLYVITSNHSAMVRAFLAKVDLLSCFRDVLGADADPSKIQKIRAIRGLHPRQSLVYVGDTRGDMREARSARTLRAAVLWGWHEPERLRAEDPDFLLEQPQDLLRLRRA
jgi:phosphoglycolate phosphatase